MSTICWYSCKSSGRAMWTNIPTDKRPIRCCWCGFINQNPKGMCERCYRFPPSGPCPKD